MRAGFVSRAASSIAFLFRELGPYFPVVGIVRELPTTRPEPRFELDVRIAEGAAVSGDFHSLFRLNVAVGWLSLTHFLITTHFTVFPLGFSQAFRS